MSTKPSARVNIMLGAKHRTLADAIARKLGGGSRSQAIRYALEQAALMLGIAARQPRTK